MYFKKHHFDGIPNFKHTTLAICIVAALASSPVVFAQETETEENNSSGIERIQVSAQKRIQDINEVGITMNAFSGEALRDFGVASAEDIAAFTPGLTVNQGGGTGVPVYTIRGVGFQDQVTTSASSTVGIYFDEVSVPYSVMSRGALFDVQRVEVLKGPQGDLYGRNTTAGQINFISNRPMDDFEMGVTASYGRFQTLDVEGFVTGGLTDTVQGRFAFKTTQASEGWQQSLTRPDDTLGEKDITAIRGMLNFDLNDATLLLKVHYVDDQSDNQAPTAFDGREIGLEPFAVPFVPANEYFLPDGQFFGQTPPFFSVGDNRVADWDNQWVSPITGEVANLRPQRDNQLFGASARLEWDFDDLVFTSITSYDKFERLEANDIDGIQATVQNTINDSDIEVFSQELRLNGETDSLYWIAGLFYSRDDASEFYNFFMQDSLFGDGSAAFNLPLPFTVAPIYRLHTRYDQESETRAIFGRAEYDFSETWSITLGLRYTQDEREWSGCTFDAGDGGLSGLWNTIFGASLAPGACGTLDDTVGSPTNIANVLGTPDINNAFNVFDTSIYVNRWMGKISVDYNISQDMLAYFTVASGFKSGGFNGANSNTTTQLAPYEPEELLSYELGFKSTLLQNRMQLNGSIYYYDYRDKQEYERAITPVGPIDGLGNIPRSEIKGAELDLKWMPTDELTLALAATYVNSEILEWNTPVSGEYDFVNGMPINVVTVDASGAALPQAPELSYNMYVQYETSISHDLILELGLDHNFTDDAPHPANPWESIEAYHITNSRIAIGNSDRDWRVMLWLRNLTDEYYYTGSFGATNGGFARRVGMPRTYGVSVEYNF